LPGRGSRRKKEDARRKKEDSKRKTNKIIKSINQ
jgi:hypothetical protein